MTHRRLLSGAAVALVLAGAQTAYAQAQIGARPVLNPVQSQIGAATVNETVEDIELRTQREIALAQDEARFGTSGVPQGFRGSVSLTGVATGGNTDAIDASVGGRFTLGQGRINHSFGFAAEYGEAKPTDEDGEQIDDEDRIRDRNRVLGVYDLSYDVNDRFYAFGIARFQYDEFAPRNEQDAFAGVGPGFRIFNEPEIAWRVQAGPGVRYTKNVDTGDTETEFAGIASSRFYYQVTNDMFLTNDTDVLYSDVDTLISNSVALNTRIAGPLSGRVGLRTDYSTDPAEGQDSTDNSVTLGVVYSFAP